MVYFIVRFFLLLTVHQHSEAVSVSFYVDQLKRDGRITGENRSTNVLQDFHNILITIHIYMLVFHLAKLTRTNNKNNNM